ncbi:MAG: ATP synthase F0 subunit B [Oligoflexia bacterium]|nr:ATP synthase F0 subunit B [Oligoflexia bacterium]
MNARRVKVSRTKVKNLISPALLALVLIFGIDPVAAFASEHGEHTPSIFDLKWLWLNFAIFVGLVAYIIRRPIATAWATRRDVIRMAVEASGRELAEAKAALHAAESKLAGVQAEISTLRKDIEREAAREAEEIVASAERRAQRILQQGKDSANAERKSAETQVRAELIELAIRQVEQKLAQELTVESDKALRESALGSVRSLVQ